MTAKARNRGNNKKGPKELSYRPPVDESDQISLPKAELGYPIFCFKHIDGSIGLKQLSVNNAKKLLDTLQILSRMQWGDIETNSYDRNGYKPMPITAFSRPKPPFLGLEVNSLIVFRVKDVGRIIGHQRGDILHICFIDFSPFKLYDHG